MPASPLLLDLDGTLIDSLADIASSANHVRAHFDLPPVPVDTVRGMIGDGAPKLIERALADAGIAVPFEQTWPIFEAHHREQCTRLVEPYPGVRETLARWRDDGRHLAVVTNKPEALALRVLEHLDLLQFFGAVIGGDSTATHKPSPEPLHEALRQLGVGSERAWMAGDGVQDLRAGRAAGLHTVGALYGFHGAAPLLAEGADVFWRAFGIADEVA